jgi:excisionase family DNA binding protein
MATMEWLSLSKAAQVLGVHPSTVRSWSDQGVLPVHRTQGGHRRYLRSEIDLWMQAQRGEAAEFNLVVQDALRNTRFQIGEGRLNSESWYSKLDEEARRQYRESGRALLRGMISAISSSGRPDMTEAEALGYEYASRGNRYNLSSVDATHAFLFFRNVLLESTLSAFEAASVRSPHAWSAMFRRITEFTDCILVKLLETYELYQRPNR